MIYNQSRIDKPLVNVSLGYVAEGFICEDLLTELNVNQWTGLFGSYGDAHRRLYNTRVLDRSDYMTVPAIDYNINKTYVVRNHGLKTPITEREIEETEQPFQAEADTTVGLKHLLLIEKEQTIATLMNASGTYPSGNSKTLTGTAQWNDYANSDPLKDFKDARTKIFETSNLTANSCILPYKVFLALQYHPKLSDKYGYSGTFQMISVEQIRIALGVDRLLVPKASYVNAAGQETLFWNRDVIFYHQAPTASKMQRTFGYRLEKTGHKARVFIKDNPNAVNSRVIFHDWAYSWSIQRPNAGYIVKNAIAV